jgi:hypothetical protein
MSDSSRKAGTASTARKAFGQGADEFGAMTQAHLKLAQAKLAAAADKPSPPPDLLLALGDSWFAYWPRGDILDVLEDRGLLDTDSLAWAGAKLTEVIEGRLTDPDDGGPLPPGHPKYRAPQTERLLIKLRGLSLADRARLRYIAVSAGGNDVADKFGTLTRLVAPFDGKPRLNEAAARQIIDIEMRDHYARLLGFIDQACIDVLGRDDIAIVLHGYDWPVPDGRPALPPAWLKPVLELKGYTELADARAVMKDLITRLNEMQVALIQSLGRPNLHHIDLQGTLKSTDHTADWQNELHPTIPSGFGAVATAFHDQLLALGAPAYVGKAAA